MSQAVIDVLRGRGEAQGNRVLKARVRVRADMHCIIDPKPGELALDRMKADENRLEVRTGELFNTLG